MLISIQHVRDPSAEFSLTLGRVIPPTLLAKLPPNIAFGNILEFSVLIGQHYLAVSLLSSADSPSLLQFRPSQRLQPDSIEKTVALVAAANPQEKQSSIRA